MSYYLLQGKYKLIGSNIPLGATQTLYSIYNREPLGATGLTFAILCT